MNCVICDAAVVLRGHALLAPFIAELSGGGTKTLSLLHCSTCDFDFFSHRYDKLELSSLYGTYRSRSYLEARQRWEPWYTRGVNESYERGSSTVVARRTFMSELLQTTGPDHYDLAVDYGGDEGQFFPDAAAGRRVVIEVSGKPMPAGIELAASFSDLGDKPDLVMACHVLEHLNEPANLINEIRANIRSGGTLYVEVPLDRPRLRKWHSSNGYAWYLRSIQSHRWGLIAADFVSGLMRQFHRRLPHFGLLKQSEHINYFNEQSLKACVERSGFEVVACKADPCASVGGLRLGKLGLVAKPR